MNHRNFLVSRPSMAIWELIEAPFQPSKITPAIIFPSLSSPIQTSPSRHFLFILSPTHLPTLSWSLSMIRESRPVQIPRPWPAIAGQWHSCWFLYWARRNILFQPLLAKAATTQALIPKFRYPTDPHPITRR